MLFHWAHRFRLHAVRRTAAQVAGGPLAVLCYGGAVVGSIAALLIVVML